MTNTYISTAEAKEDFAEIINRVFHNKERIILTRREKEVAAIISIDDLHILIKAESKNDLKEATEALQEARTKGTVSIEQVKEELGVATVNTTPYYIKVAPAARRQLSAMSLKQRKLIIKFIEALAINPRPPGVEKIEGMMGLYSEEVENVRLVFKVEDQEVLLLLVK